MKGKVTTMLRIQRVSGKRKIKMKETSSRFRFQNKELQWLDKIIETLVTDTRFNFIDTLNASQKERP